LKSATARDSGSDAFVEPAEKGFFGAGVNWELAGTEKASKRTEMRQALELL
jgi:hypothetical protein